jgi:hypothetical protein
MKIRIVKSSDPQYWYVHHIGEVFEVKRKDESEKEYDVITNDVYGGGYVQFNDAEEVIEHNSKLYRKVDRPVREGDTVLITKFDRLDVKWVRKVTSLGTYEGDFRFGSDLNTEEFFDCDVDECFVLERIEKAVEPKVNIVEHNGKQYRKVKRQANVGDFIYYPIDDRYAVVVPDGGTVTKSEETFLKTTGEYEHFVLELVEQSGQSELDLIANLAQEVAELKRELQHAKTDIADLEDRVDESEKDTEELIGRMNDLCDGAEAAGLSEALTELTRLEVESASNAEMFEAKGMPYNSEFQQGSAYAYNLAIKKIKEALRNG